MLLDTSLILPTCAVKYAGFGVNVNTPDNEKTPTVIVIPGLTSDSSAAVSYISFSNLYVNFI